MILYRTPIRITRGKKVRALTIRFLNLIPSLIWGCEPVNESFRAGPHIDYSFW